MPALAALPAPAQLEGEIILRDYQLRAVGALRAALDQHRSVLVACPTGSGKTEIALHLLRARRRALFVTPRRALIEDVLARCERYGIPAINATDWQRRRYATHYDWPDSVRVIVGSATAIEDRVRALDKADWPTFAVFDEAHHAAAPDRWVKQLNIAARLARWLGDVDCDVLGMTATPVRLESDWGFDRVFGRLLVAARYDELRAGGWLVPVQVEGVNEAELVIADDADLTGAGDYAERGIMARSSAAALYDAPTRSLLALRDAGRRCLVYCVGQPHALELAQRLDASTGLRLGFTVSGNKFLAAAPGGVLVGAEAIAAFRSGDLDALINVAQLTLGFDDPECDAALVLRPTKSVGLWRQIAGRLTRPASGKTHGLLIDAAGNLDRLGAPDVDCEWSLLSVDVQEAAAAERERRAAAQLEHVNEISTLRGQLNELDQRARRAETQLAASAAARRAGRRPAPASAMVRPGSTPAPKPAPARRESEGVCACGGEIWGNYKVCSMCDREARGLSRTGCIDCGEYSGKYPRCRRCNEAHKARRAG